MAFRHGAITAALEAVFLETVPACGTKRSSARLQEAQNTTHRKVSFESGKPIELKLC